MFKKVYLKPNKVVGITLIVLAVIAFIGFFVWFALYNNKPLYANSSNYLLFGSLILLGAFFVPLILSLTGGFLIKKSKSKTKKRK